MCNPILPEINLEYPVQKELDEDVKENEAKSDHDPWSLTFGQVADKNNCERD
jgi:hypothetical protein